VLKLRQLGLKLREHGRRIGLVGRGAADDRADARVAQQRLGFRRAVGRVQGREHRADPRGGVVDEDKIGAAGQLHGNHVAAPDPVRGQRAGEPFAARERVAESERRQAGRRYRDRVRRLARPAAQIGRDRVAVPTAAREGPRHRVRREAQRGADGERVFVQMRRVCVHLVTLDRFRSPDGAKRHPGHRIRA
jgi:hypothetical protein